MHIRLLAHFLIVTEVEPEQVRVGCQHVVLEAVLEHAPDGSIQDVGADGSRVHLQKEVANVRRQ